MQAQKSENPAIAIETLKISAALLSLPLTIQVNDDLSLSKVNIKTSPSRELAMSINKSEAGYDVFVTEPMAAAAIASTAGLPPDVADKIANFRTIPLASAPDYPSALVGILYAAVSDVITAANTKAVADYTKTAVEEHKQFCENCRELVPLSEFGTTACKKCEA